MSSGTEVGPSITPGRSPVRLWSGFGSYCVRSRDHLVGLSTNVVLVASRDLDHTSKYFAAAGALPVTVSRSQDCIGCREVNGDTVDNRCDLRFLGRSGVRIMTPQDHRPRRPAHSRRDMARCANRARRRDRVRRPLSSRRNRTAAVGAPRLETWRPSARAEGPLVNGRAAARTQASGYPKRRSSRSARVIP
jgi:hypothetical protein